MANHVASEDWRMQKTFKILFANAFHLLINFYLVTQYLLCKNMLTRQVQKSKIVKTFDNELLHASV